MEKFLSTKIRFPKKMVRKDLRKKLQNYPNCISRRRDIIQSFSNYKEHLN
jgi:hypothetical protein